MRKVLACAALIALPAHAQDMPSLKGCYVETSVAGTFLAAGPREGQLGAGLGCDTRIDLIVLGGGIRGDFGDFKSGSAYAKLGFALNPHLHLYGLGEWKVPDWKIRSAGQLHIGAGVETSVLFNGVSAFLEGTTSLAKFGPAAANEDIAIRLGARYRF